MTLPQPVHRPVNPQPASGPKVLFQAPESAPLHNLGAPLTRFVGRAAEMSALMEHLRSERLVTLTGLGGMGKTRMALQAAWACVKEHPDWFPDGVFFVPLGAVYTADVLVFSIAETLQMPYFGGSDLTKQLLNFLRARHTLLVLDNFEQLTEAADLLVELLEQAAGLKLLVTSRERLNVYGEWAFPLGGLGLPRGDSLSDAEAAEAVDLFTQSARRVSPDFALNAQTAPDVARICRAVQGHPLALELAGAWMRAMRCDEVAEAIERDLDFLSADWDLGSARSLRATIGHSWEMLDLPERRAFMRLSAFVGPFGREAARAVADASTGMLTALVSKSFLTWSSQRGVYDIHPLLRRFGAEKLAADSARQQETLGRFCAYWMDFLRERADAIVGAEQPRILREIVEMYDNIRAAWDWAVENRDVAQLERGAQGLFAFCDARSLLTEGEAALGRAIESLQGQASEGEAGSALIARLKARRAALLFRMGKGPEARDILQESIETLAEPGELAFCLNKLGYVLIFLGKHTEALQVVERARALGQDEAENQFLLGRIADRQGHPQQAETHYQVARQLHAAQGNRRSEAISIHALGMKLVDKGEHSAGMSMHLQALEMFRALGDLYWEGVMYDELGYVCREQGLYSQSQAYREQALALARQIGDMLGQARALNNLGTTRMYLGDYAAAQEYLNQALPLFRAMGRKLGEAVALMNLGNLLHELGREEEASLRAQESLEIVRPMQDGMYEAYALTTLGDAALGLGALEEAESAYLQAYQLRQQLDQQHLAAESLAGLALARLRRGFLRQALADAAQTWQFLQERPPEGVEAFLMYRAVYEVFSAHGDAHAGEVIRAGYALLMERAAKIAEEAARRSFLEQVPHNRFVLETFVRLNPPRPGADLPDPLTKQELEILRLLAEGLSNQAVADKLVISVGTVKFHVHNLCRKLEAESRSQAVAKARGLGLLEKT